MKYINVEIKARCADADTIRSYLKNNNADYMGTDMQTDTYFNVQHGRLKLREGNIENNLIWYDRDNKAGPKTSLFNLIKIPDTEGFKSMMEKAAGIKVVVKKKREIWFIENVKFHIDEVPGLGNFVEIEAGNKLKDLPKEKLQEQCDFYMQELNIKQEDLIRVSYSDMMIEKNR